MIASNLPVKLPLQKLHMQHQKLWEVIIEWLLLVGLIIHHYLILESFIHSYSFIRNWQTAIPDRQGHQQFKSIMLNEAKLNKLIKIGPQVTKMAPSSKINSCWALFAEL